MAVDGRRAVVTGGGSGIGAGIALRLREAGAEVVTVDVDATTRPTVVADVGADGDALARRLLAEHGPFDLIVNNVGVSSETRFLELGEEEWDRVFAVNLRGPWFLTRRLVQALIDSRRPGSIVFTSSLHDTFVFGAPHYSATKAAVAMLVKELAWELAPRRIRVNAIAPGDVPTGRRASEAGVDPRIAMHRTGTPDDIARVALALLDDDVCGYVTGARIQVDGGLGLFNWMHEPRC